MRPFQIAAACLLALCLFGATPLKAVDTKADVAIEPQSIAALKKMGAYLVSLKSFQLRSANNVEVVLDNDQKIQVQGLVHYLVRRPDHLRINFLTDTIHRELYYDGKTVTLVSPEDRFYAKADAPPTIKKMLEKIVADYGVALPLSDLFDWGTPDAPIAKIREGFFVGKALIAGTPCDHWAFRTDDLDWEIWIQSSGAPLPRKFAIVDRSDRTLPRYDAQLDWVPNENLKTDLFTYTPPPGTARIGFLPVNGRPQK